MYGADLRSGAFMDGLPGDHADAVADQRQAEQVEQVERPDDRPVRFQEFPREALRRVDDDEQIERVAHEERLAHGESPEGKAQKRSHGQRLVELHRMARDTVAEVPAPGGAGGYAVGLIVEAREQAADPADGDAGRKSGDEDE